MTLLRPFVFAVAVFALSSSIVHAADDKPQPNAPQSCNQDTTMEIEQCLMRLTKAWDQRLNEAYKKLLKDNQKAEELRAAQRLWVQFRDANCKYYGAGDGTITRIDFAECMRSTTAQRAQELEQLAKGDGG